MIKSDSAEKLETLLKSAQPLITIQTVEEDRVRPLVRVAALNLDLKFHEWSVIEGFAHSPAQAEDQTADPIECLTFIKSFSQPAVFFLKDFSQHLSTPSIIRYFREVASGLSRSSAIVLCSPKIELPIELSHLAVPFALALPNSIELRELLKAVVDNVSRSQKIKIDISQEDLGRLIASLSGLTLRQARQILTYAMVIDGALTADDIDLILQRKGSYIEECGVLEFFPPPAQKLHVGGFKGIKSWLSTAAVARSESARKLNIPAPKGILLVGIPGCGKSLCAKMIAAEWQQPLLRLDASRLFDKFIGESERNFRRATEIAEAMAPCILWVDEIEKLMGTHEANDGGVGLRMFGAFLTWMQEKRSEIFLVATANDLSALRPELLRKGRFDEIFFVDLPSEIERAEIFSVQLGAHHLSPTDFDLGALAQATAGFSGAEIEQVLTTGILRCLQTKQSISSEAIVNEAKLCIPLSQSRAEEIQTLRAEAIRRFRPASQ